MNKLIETAKEIDKILKSGIEILPDSPIHEKLRRALNIACVMPRFAIDYTFTDRTDATIYTDIIEAETAEIALNLLHKKHNYKIEWRTVNGG
ncbi:MAG: hypothetical protein HN347_16185 [Bacteroidetes bacterium]|nr:hypothetical protein [Bacteroidota bacterium]